MATPEGAVRELDPVRVWVGNLCHGLSRQDLWMALGDMGLDPEELAVYHKDAGANSAAILRFEREEDASAAVRRLHGIRSAVLQGVHQHAPVKARFAFASAPAAGARLASAFEEPQETKGKGGQAPIITLPSQAKATDASLPRTVPPKAGCPVVRGLVKLPSAAKAKPSVAPSKAPSVAVKRERGSTPTSSSRSPTPPWRKSKTDHTELSSDAEHTRTTIEARNAE